MHHPGKFIMSGKYRLQELLGKGAQGEVWAAQQTGIGLFTKEVVLKFVALDGANKQKLQSALLHEARISAELSHPAIVTVFDVGEEEGQVFLAMERIRGLDLSRVAELQLDVHQQPLPWELVCYAIKRVCRGLHFAHTKKRPDGQSMGIVHRDLKPHNILVSEQGEVKIIDFGIAKVHQSLRKTQTDAIKGTPAYMSPEQIAAKPLDARSDLFSLGVILYELLSGDVPFYAPEMFSILYLIMECKPTPLGEVAPDIPPALADLVMQLLRKEPAERPASAKAVRLAIDGILVEHGVRVSEDSLLDYFEELREEGAAYLEERASFDGGEDAAPAPTPEAIGPPESGGTIVYTDSKDAVPASPKRAEPLPSIGHTAATPVPPKVVWSQGELPESDEDDDEEGDTFFKTTPDPDPLDDVENSPHGEEIALAAPSQGKRISALLALALFALCAALVWAFFFGRTVYTTKQGSPASPTRALTPPRTLPQKRSPTRRVVVPQRAPRRVPPTQPNAPRSRPRRVSLRRRRKKARPVYGQLHIVLQPAMLLFEERKGGRRSLTRVPQRSIVLKRKRGRYCFFATNRKARARVSFCLNVVPGKSVKVRKAVRFGEVKIVAQKGLVFLGDFGQVGVTGRWLKLPVGLHLLKVVQEDDPMVRKVLKVRVLRSQRALLRLK